MPESKSYENTCIVLYRQRPKYPSTRPMRSADARIWIRDGRDIRSSYLIFSPQFLRSDQLFQVKKNLLVQSPSKCGQPLVSSRRHARLGVALCITRPVQIFQRQNAPEKGPTAYLNVKRIGFMKSFRRGSLENAKLDFAFEATSACGPGSHLGLQH